MPYLKKLTVKGRVQGEDPNAMQVEERRKASRGRGLLMTKRALFKQIPKSKNSKSKHKTQKYELGKQAGNTGMKKQGVTEDKNRIQKQAV